MDQQKIGAFIAHMRRSKSLTQRGLAEILGISDKTVSKWERGGGLPEFSLMQPLCRALDIDLNELFSGRRLSGADFRAQANENLMALIRQAESARLNIVGAETMGEISRAEASDAAKINTEFWNDAGNDLLSPITLPQWSPFLPDENSLNLLGDLSGKRVLEICCGRGGSMEYIARRGAFEIWGADISPAQLVRAKEFLDSRSIRANLVCTPMEVLADIPADYFDCAYSVFGIGWTGDVDKTFSAINSCLKPGGIFVFSWSHPMHKCTALENGCIMVANSYFDESGYSAAIGNCSFILANRMLSTWINALTRCNFAVECLTEAHDERRLHDANDPFAAKAKIVPTAFVLKGRKLA